MEQSAIDKEKELEKVQEQLKKIYEVSSTEYKSDTVKGYDFNNGIDLEGLMKAFQTTGFQCTQFHLASKQIMAMIDDQSTIFLGYTSNMVSSGTREIIRYLVQHKMVDVLVTSAGGIEEDFIKCILPFFIGSWNVNDQELRRNSINRIGNIFVPSLNYCKFEEWLLPIFKEMLDEQTKNHKIWSPSQMIKLLGEKIDNPDSIYYWAAKNDIPVFCPAITDGAIGDMLFFNSYKNEGLILDLVQDVVKLNKIAIQAKTSGVITLGAGLIKHHILNANIWRNGAVNIDYGVFINTAIDFDGSDSGAKPTEAVTWGKVKINSETVKIFGEASFIFPFLVANTFAKNVEKASKLSKKQEEEKFVL